MSIKPCESVVEQFKINICTEAYSVVDIDWDLSDYNSIYRISHEFTLPIVGGTWTMEKDFQSKERTLTMSITLVKKEPHSENMMNMYCLESRVKCEQRGNEFTRPCLLAPQRPGVWSGLIEWSSNNTFRGTFMSTSRIIVSLKMSNSHRKDAMDINSKTTLRVQSESGDIAGTNCDSLLEQLTSFFSLGEKKIELRTPCGFKVDVNRDILMARSQVFRAMFSHDMVEDKTREVNVEDVDPEVLQAMVHFINTDTVPSEQLAKYAEKLLIAADKYELSKLQRICEQQLISTLAESDVFRVMELADTINSVSLKKGCWDVLLAETSDRKMWKKLFHAQEERLHNQEKIIRKNGLQGCKP